MPILGAAGGVGLAAVEVCKAIGARAIAAASTPEKLAICASRGADELIDYGHQDLRAALRSLVGSTGVDAVYDPVGGERAEPALRSLAWRGRYLVVGFAAGEIPRIPLILVLLKGASLIGVFLGEAWSRDPDVVRGVVDGIHQAACDGKLRPYVSATYPLSQAVDGMRALLERRVTGKVVLTP